MLQANKPRRGDMVGFGEKNADGWNQDEAGMVERLGREGKAKAWTRSVEANQAGDFPQKKRWKNSNAFLILRFAHGMQQRHVGRALRANGITADQHNLLPRLNARLREQSRINQRDHFIHGVGEVCKIGLNAP
jgi:hypothetical protein